MWYEVCFTLITRFLHYIVNYIISIIDLHVSHKHASDTCDVHITVADNFYPPRLYINNSLRVCSKNMYCIRMCAWSSAMIVSVHGVLLNY